MFALVGAVWLSSLLVVAPLGLAAGWLAGRRPGAGAVAACALWTASAALVLVPAVEAWLGRSLFGLRGPTGPEAARLLPIWRSVCLRASVAPDRWLLCVEDRPQLNALAAGRRSVAVTGLALRLPDGLLAAVLAHELGHHHALHPVAAMLGWWFFAPFVAIDRCLRWAGRVTRWLGSLVAALARVIGVHQARGGALVEGVLGLLALLGMAAVLALAAAVALAVFAVVWLPLAILAWAARLGSAALSRSGEYAADRYAADLGLGRPLIAVLALLIRQELDQPRPHRGRLRALGDRHPPSTKRIAALERLAATRGDLDLA